MVNTLQPVIDVQLRSHQDEPEQRYEGHSSLQYKSVVSPDHPTPLIQSIHQINSHQRHQQIVHVPHRLVVNLLPLLVQLTSRQLNERNLFGERDRVSTRDYLVRQGIEQSRIIEAKGFGETQLMNTCENGVTCEEAQHQLNRRSEFIIVKI